MSISRRQGSRKTRKVRYSARPSAGRVSCPKRSMSRVDAWYMVRRRARDAGIETAIGNHSFRAIGITDYLERGGDINIAKRMAGHSNVKTTELYDRRGDEVSFSEIERVGI
jgi:integrase/recombinase XerD